MTRTPMFAFLLLAVVSLSNAILRAVDGDWAVSLFACTTSIAAFCAALSWRTAMMWRDLALSRTERLVLRQSLN